MRQMLCAPQPDDARSHGGIDMALSGVKVIDLTRILAGPFCTQLLADMGAEVIKVESPGRGDPVRKQGAQRDGFSWYFAQFNRNKKSVAIDLYSEQGKALLAKMIEGADVLVENFRPGVLAKMGFSESHLKQLNPDLIVTSVSGYGSTGPYHDRPSFDFIAQAMSGFMSVNGDDGAAPMRSGPPLADLIAGLYAAFGTVSALYQRKQTGTSQKVESTLLGGLFSLMAYLSADALETGENPQRTGNDHPVVAPYGLFTAKDGDVAIAPSNDEFVRRLFDVLGLSALLEQDEYHDNASRMRNRPQLNKLVNEKIQDQSVDYWIDVLNAAGVPCGRVMTLTECFDDPQVQAQNLVLDVDHGDQGVVRMTGFAVNMSETPARIRRPAPQLGQHTDAVLTTLGVEKDELAQLYADGVIA